MCRRQRQGRDDGEVRYILGTLATMWCTAGARTQQTGTCVCSVSAAEESYLPRWTHHSKSNHSIEGGMTLKDEHALPLKYTACETAAERLRSGTTGNSAVRQLTRNVFVMCTGAAPAATERRKNSRIIV